MWMRPLLNLISLNEFEYSCACIDTKHIGIFLFHRDTLSVEAAVMKIDSQWVFLTISLHVKRRLYNSFLLTVAHFRVWAIICYSSLQMGFLGRYRSLTAIDYTKDVSERTRKYCSKVCSCTVGYTPSYPHNMLIGDIGNIGSCTALFCCRVWPRKCQDTHLMVHPTR